MKPEAMDAAELILNTLREHEKELDRLIERLEKVVAAQEKGRGMFGARM